MRSLSPKNQKEIQSKPFRTVLRSAQIVMQKEILAGDLVIENTKITQIEKKIQGEFEQEIDCTGLTILPGIIDTHVHFRDPGLTQKEDFASGSLAGVSGGVTTVFEMPNTIPATISQATLLQKKEIAHNKSLVNYNMFVALTKDNFTEINQLKNIAGIKIFFGSSTGNLLVNDLEYLENVFQKTQHLLAFHAEDESIIQENLQKYAKNLEPSIHSKIRDRKAEIQAIRTVLLLAQKHPQTHVHFCHVSTQETVDLLSQANLPNVTAETSMHHLLLNQTAYAQFGNFVKVNPPLRNKTDNEKLLNALQKGIIQTIATDHAPHLKNEKEKNYHEAPSGMPMVELTLPLLLDLHNQGKISLHEISRWTASKPAEIWKIKNKGEIKIGNDADLAIVDLCQKWTILNEKLFTKCKWSPFVGQELQGKVIYTFVNGELVFEKDKIVTSAKSIPQREIIFPKN